MVEIDASAAQNAARRLERLPGAARRAINTAIRKSISGAKQDAVRKVKERYTLRSVYITRTIKTYRTAFGASIISRGRVNDLAYFKTNPTRPPKRRPPKGKYLYSQVVKGEGGTIAHAFLARMKSGHVGVFQRAGHGAGHASLPIEKLAGPSTPSMLGSPTVSAFIQKRMAERVSGNLDHEVNAFLMGYRT
ncbi:phage tail protein [Selenomonas artemidis]|jgi:hypothetical protein|uniref:phage tail protein n=1 Tax=Selenomonas artemidis TaxID=671224 RepID=UPI00205EB93A|nr:phage tail protein [Selenomonas artemidis]DAF35336.1 MAG TPA: minor tail protein Z [Caudoviricetes sp.]